MEEVTVRAVREHEWRNVRELRLAALRDEVAAIAFVDTIESALARPDTFWQERTRDASVEAGPKAAARQFVAITGADVWIGSVTVLVEKPGETDFEGAEITRPAAALVGVYLDKSARGRGILQSMFESALDWARERGLPHARLYVHADNLRAQKAYVRAGFSPTGKALTGSLGAEIEMARSV